MSNAKKKRPMVPREIRSSQEATNTAAVCPICEGDGVVYDDLTQSGYTTCVCVEEVLISAPQLRPPPPSR